MNFSKLDVCHSDCHVANGVTSWFILNGYDIYSYIHSDMFSNKNWQSDKRLCQMHGWHAVKPTFSKHVLGWPSRHSSLHTTCTVPRSSSPPEAVHDTGWNGCCASFYPQRDNTWA